MTQFTAPARLLFSVALTLACCAAAPAAETNPPPLMLAKVYDEHIDLAGYWVSEKLDGVRAYWNGRQLLSRNGNVYHAPDWFTADFPETPLDGELWMGRNTFSQLSGAVRRNDPVDAEWRDIRFMVFDLPASEDIFDKRLIRLRKLVAENTSPYLNLVEQRKITSQEQLQKRLDTLVAQGAEGLMLHKGSSRYRARRTDDLLKLKPYWDAEATVVGHLPGKGKFQGMLGALLVETPAGLRFKIGTGFTDAQRRDPPPMGSTVTYKYYGTTRNGIPRFASFLRERTGFKSSERR